MVSPQFRPPHSARRPVPPKKSSRPARRSRHSQPTAPPFPQGQASGTKVRRRVVSPQAQSRPQSRLNRAIVVQTLEIGIKLGVNGILGVAAIVGLVKLVPYTLHRHSGLQQLQAEAYAVEARVNNLQKEFHRYFDPKEAAAIARQETIRIGPNQQRVYLQTEPITNPAP